MTLSGLRVGIDAVEPERVERLISRHGEKVAVFTTAEIEYCEAQIRPSLSFAARFAAKEAVVKALAIDGFDPQEIEVAQGSPAPRIQLWGEVRAIANRQKLSFELSLTHLETIAIAIVVAYPHSA